MEPAPSTVALPRRERERVMRRTSILAAARHVFAGKGFAGATLDEIAAEAEFGKGTLYNYFPGGKEELLVAVVEGVYDELMALVDRSFADDDAVPARQRFERFLERSFELFGDNWALFAILMKESYRMALSERRERVQVFVEQRGRVARALAVPLRRAMERGEIRPLPPEAVAHMLLGNIQGCQVLLSLGECGSMRGDAAPAWNASDAARFLTVMLFDGLLLSGPAVNSPSESAT
jgi:AcrR family transcriptional regulator